MAAQAIQKALARLRHLCNVRGYVVGGPVYETKGSQVRLDQLRAEAETLGLTDRVIVREKVNDIEDYLQVADIGLCLDTGHLLLGGGDPVRALSDWGSRINQIHLKDARRSVMAAIAADGAPTAEIWTREAFVPLGAGDLDVDGVLDRLRAMGYEGWLVVEQDSFPQTRERFERASRDQRANREFLARHGL